MFRFFLLYCPSLIESGRFYGAVPPLYGVKIKGKFRYFTEKLDFVRYVQNSFASNHKLCTLKGDKFTTNESVDLLFKNMEYVEELDVISNTYAIDPFLLEKCLMNCNVDFSTFKKVIEKDYRFLKVRKDNKNIILEGLVGSDYHTIIFNEKLLKSCESLLKYINNSPNYFVMDDKVISLYTLMKEFDSAAPSGITRYKGIGEMDPDQLKESALHPDSNRTLLRYTVEDIKAEIELVRYMESNKQEFIEMLKAGNISKRDVM